VDPYLKLIPFTAFNAESLGNNLAAIVRKPTNSRLFVDFPHLRKTYGDADTATTAVRERQQDMEAEPTYMAMAVILGTSQETAEVRGAVSMNCLPIPLPHQIMGVHTAAWLAPNRPRELKGVGQQLLKLCIEWLIRLSAFNGPLWSLIRPGNKGSRPVWADAKGPLTFKVHGKAEPRPDLDGITTPRELFVSTQPIESLRLR